MWKPQPLENKIDRVARKRSEEMQSVFFSENRFSVAKRFTRKARHFRPQSLLRMKKHELHLSPVSLSVFSLAPDLLFDCSRVLDTQKCGLFCSLVVAMLMEVLPEQLGQGNPPPRGLIMIHCPWLHKYSCAGFETKSKPPLHITAHTGSPWKSKQARAPFLGGG